MKPMPLVFVCMFYFIVFLFFYSTAAFLWSNRDWLTEYCTLWTILQRHCI